MATDPPHSDEQLELLESFVVIRVSGLLVPGFTKRFDARRRRGVTYLSGVGVGRFTIEPRPARDGLPAGIDLMYDRWPIRDVLVPRLDGSFDGIGMTRSRRRFCEFRLVPMSLLIREREMALQRAGG